jgi:8-oxo-dGTP pyrophosphatase MutT (NUDIX family)
MKKLTDWINENRGEIKHYVDGILVSEDEKILILRRANYMKNFGGQWGFVGGSVDKKDKNNKEAIIREIEEETKIKLTFNEQQKMKAIDKQEHENNGSVVSDTEYWLIKLESNPDVKISREHSKYEWIDADTFKNKTFKFMPDVFNYIQKYFNGDL